MVTFFVVLAAILAVLITIILRAYFNQVIPEGLPTDQHQKLRIFGIVIKAMGTVVWLTSAFNHHVFSGMSCF